MSDELGSNSTGKPHERSSDRSGILRSESVDPQDISSEKAQAEDSDLENYWIPGYVVEDEPTAEDLFASETLAKQATAQTENFYAPRPFLGRGFDANAYRPSAPLAPPAPISTPPNPLAPPHPQLGIDSATGLAVPLPVVTAPKIWEKQPYRAIAHISAIAGTLTAAWLLGILAARIIPGTIQRPPLQESILRKSSRLAAGLWHLPQLWQTPTAETRIEAIPLPETGPILAPVKLPPLERQPVIDELNTVENRAANARSANSNPGKAVGQTALSKRRY